MKNFVFIFALILVSQFAFADQIEILENEKTIVISGEISEALGKYDEHLRGAVEFLICAKGGKDYESLIVLDAMPIEVIKAIEMISVQKGSPPIYNPETDQMTSPKGPTFVIYVEWEIDGKKKKVRAEDLLAHTKSEDPVKRIAWIYSGSREVPDLESDDEEAMIPHAVLSNSIVALNHFDSSALFQHSSKKAIENVFKKNEKNLPPLGTRVKVRFEVNREIQFHLSISGKVQGVGFRHFTRQNAKKLGLVGYVKNLSDGTVEAIVRGRKSEVDQLIERLWIGPTLAKVSNVKIVKQSIDPKYKTFEVRF